MHTKIFFILNIFSGNPEIHVLTNIAIFIKNLYVSVLWLYTKTVESAFTNSLWLLNFNAFVCSLLRPPWLEAMHTCIFFKKDFLQPNVIFSWPFNSADAFMWLAENQNIQHLPAVSCSSEITESMLRCLNNGKCIYLEGYELRSRFSRARLSLGKLLNKLWSKEKYISAKINILAALEAQESCWSWKFIMFIEIQMLHFIWMCAHSEHLKSQLTMKMFRQLSIIRHKCRRTNQFY